jgi:hypothetical protein
LESKGEGIPTNTKGDDPSLTFFLRGRLFLAMMCGITAALQFYDNVYSSPNQTAPVELDPGWLGSPLTLSGNCFSKRPCAKYLSPELCNFGREV